MATHRAIPGANLPESGTTPAGKSRNGGEVGQGRGTGLGNSLPGQSALPGESGDILPGESGLGTGLGSGPDTFGTTAEPAPGSTGNAFGTPSAGSSSPREFPRPVGVIDQVKRQASTRVNEQKERAAQGLGSVASAIRQASEHMRSENQMLATYADRAVDQIQLFADRMRDKEPEEMVRDLEQFGRRNPAAFVGGAFLLGLGLARFLKSSGTSSELHARDVRHGDTDFGGGDRRSTTSLAGATGYTAPDGLARPDDLSRPSAGMTTASTPGITS
jgi:hypothetical protein